MSESKPVVRIDPIRGIALAEGPKVVRRIRSEDLFGDAEEVLIEHNGRTYLLRKGAHGGLVLTA